jgi:hypothetical protein
MADENAKIKIDTTVDNKGLEKGLKSADKTVREFAKGFANQLSGIDSIMQAVAGGPVAVGQAAAEMAQSGVAELNSYAEAWRATDEAARKLAYAAESNPYLNGKAVGELQAFADEMEVATGLDGDMMLDAETRLAALGRDQEQITKILRTAADMDATGLMSFDEAVAELNSSYNGLACASVRLLPEIKSLTQEELAAGKAVDLLAAKVEGGAARAMGTAGGSVRAYEVAVDNLKKTIGGGWEEATQPARKWITGIINSINEALTKQERLRAAFGDVNTTAEEAFEADAQHTKEIADRIARELFSIQQDFRNGYIEMDEAQRKINGSLAEMSALTGATKGQIGEIVQKYGDLSGLAPDIMAVTNEIIAQNRAVDEQRKAEEARTAAVAEGDRKSRDAQQQREADGSALEDITKKNKAALEAEIAKIEELARINGKSVESAEVQRQILDARINAYYSLLEEGEDYLQLVKLQEKDTLSVLEAEGRRVGALAEGERAAEAAAREEEERSAERVKNIDAAIEAQGRLAASMLELAGGAALEGEKSARAAALRETLLAEKAAEDERLNLHKTAIEKAAAMSEEGLDARLAQRIAEITAEEEYALKALQKELDERRKASEQAIQDINDNETLLAEEKAARIQRINGGMASAEESFQRYREELWRRTEDKIAAAHGEAAETMEEREKEMYAKMASAVGEYSGYAREAAQAIHEIWSGVIQAELDERLEALDKENLSAEERAAAEKALRKTAAEEQHKAALFQWGINMAMAAAIAAAKPKKPSFHSGGVVAGRGEVDATLLGGEVVQTSGQFKTVMDAFANIADMSGASASAPTVVINNNAPGARVERPQIDNNKIIVAIRQIVSETIASGEANGAFDRKDAYDRGQNLMTF